MEEKSWGPHVIAGEVAGFAPHAVAEATDFSTQLALVTAGVGVALIRELGCIAVPEQVTLRRLAQPVHRHLHLAIRRGGRTDRGLARLADLLRDAARTTLATGWTGQQVVANELAVSGLLVSGHLGAGALRAGSALRIHGDLVGVRVGTEKGAPDLGE